MVKLNKKGNVIVASIVIIFAVIAVFLAYENVSTKTTYDGDKITGMATAKSCVFSFQCNDNDPCTTDRCIFGRCMNRPKCGNGYSCVNGKCISLKEVACENKECGVVNLLGINYNCGSCQTGYSCNDNVCVKFVEYPKNPQPSDCTVYFDKSGNRCEGDCNGNYEYYGVYSDVKKDCTRDKYVAGEAQIYKKDAQFLFSRSDVCKYNENPGLIQFMFGNIHTVFINDFIENTYNEICKDGKMEYISDPKISDCIPNCENKQCGDDGCGGQCGVNYEFVNITTHCENNNVIKETRYKVCVNGRYEVMLETDIEECTSEEICQDLEPKPGVFGAGCYPNCCKGGVCDCECTTSRSEVCEKARDYLLFYHDLSSSRVKGCINNKCEYQLDNFKYCSSDMHCDDKDPCTKDICNEGICSNYLDVLMSGVDICGKISCEYTTDCFIHPRGTGFYSIKSDNDCMVIYCEDGFCKSRPRVKGAECGKSDEYLSCDGEGNCIVPTLCKSSIGDTLQHYCSKQPNKFTCKISYCHTDRVTEVLEPYVYVDESEIATCLDHIPKMPLDCILDTKGDGSIVYGFCSSLTDGKCVECIPGWIGCQAGYLCENNKCVSCDKLEYSDICTGNVCGEVYEPCSEKTYNCGDCKEGFSCIGNICCEPNCEGKKCGDSDGCGGICKGCDSVTRTKCSVDGTEILKVTENYVCTLGRDNRYRCTYHDESNTPSSCGSGRICQDGACVNNYCYCSGWDPRNVACASGYYPDCYMSSACRCKKI